MVGEQGQVIAGLGHRLECRRDAGDTLAHSGEKDMPTQAWAWHRLGSGFAGFYQQAHAGGGMAPGRMAWRPLSESKNQALSTRHQILLWCAA